MILSSYPLRSESLELTIDIDIILGAAIGSLIATVVGGFLLHRIENSWPSIKKWSRCRCIGVKRRASNPVFRWLGWIVLESEMKLYANGAWDDGGQLHRPRRGERKRLRAVVSSLEFRSIYGGELIGWNIHLFTGGNNVNCWFPLDRPLNKSKYFQRITGNERVIFQGTVDPALPNGTFTFSAGELIGVWRKWDHQSWQRVAGWVDIPDTSSTGCFSLGKWIGRRFRR